MTMSMMAQPGPADRHGAEPEGARQARLAAMAHVRAERMTRAYRSARWHTRLVRFLRVAIPLGAVLSFGGFIVWPFFDPFRDMGVTVGAVKMDGTRVTMESPRLAGHRKDNRPYEVTAASAVQDIRVPNVIELIEMRARLVNSDDNVLNVTARKAIFDTQKEQLQLREDVRLRTAAGQEAVMMSADVDFKAGTVRSREPVTIRLPDMSVSADGLDVVDSGALITFTGRVSAMIDDKDSQKAGRGPGAGQGLPQSSPAPAAPAASGGGLPAGGLTVIDPATGRAVARSNP